MHGIESISAMYLMYRLLDNQYEYHPSQCSAGSSISLASLAHPPQPAEFLSCTCTGNTLSQYTAIRPSRRWQIVLFGMISRRDVKSNSCLKGSASAPRSSRLRACSQSDYN